MTCNFVDCSLDRCQAEYEFRNNRARRSTVCVLVVVINTVSVDGSREHLQGETLSCGCTLWCIILLPAVGIYKSIRHHNNNTTVH